MVRDYIKITEQDLKLAEDFFENDKHFNEWLVNVVRYYRGNKVEIKTKIVQKYFNNYKKTMDYILNSITTGGKGAAVKAEKQTVKEATLEGVVKPSLEPSLKPNIETVIEKKEDKIDFNFFWDLYGNKTNRKKSRAKWDKLNTETQELIIKTLPDFLAYKPFESYTHPNPETYLNNERWNDVLPIAKKVEETSLLSKFKNQEVISHEDFYGTNR